MWTNIAQMIKKRLEKLTSIPADPSMLTQAVQPFLIVVTITLLSFLVVDIFYNIVGLRMAYGKVVVKSHSTAVASPWTQARSAESYHIITERNLFATTLKAIAGANAGGSLLPSEEYTAFDLKGTIAVDESMGYAIVEEKGKGKQKLYRIGEMIGSARLVSITRNTAVLKNGDKDFVMKIKDNSVTSFTGRGNRIVISKQDVTQSLGDLKSIMSQAVVKPFLKDGVQQGFVVSNIVPGSLYQKLGLRNGDVIVDVNDKRLEGADDVLQLMNVMQAGGSVSVNLLRRGQNETINYSFD